LVLILARDRLEGRRIADIDRRLQHRQVRDEARLQPEGLEGELPVLVDLHRGFVDAALQLPLSLRLTERFTM